MWIMFPVHITFEVKQGFSCGVVSRPVCPYLLLFFRRPALSFPLFFFLTLHSRQQLSHIVFFLLGEGEGSLCHLKSAKWAAHWLRGEDLMCIWYNRDFCLYCLYDYSRPEICATSFYFQCTSTVVLKGSLFIHRLHWKCDSFLNNRNRLPLDLTLIIGKCFWIKHYPAAKSKVAPIKECASLIWCVQICIKKYKNLLCFVQEGFKPPLIIMYL